MSVWSVAAAEKDDELFKQQITAVKDAPKLQPTFMEKILPTIVGLVSDAFVPGSSAITKPVAEAVGGSDISVSAPKTSPYTGAPLGKGNEPANLGLKMDTSKKNYILDDSRQQYSIQNRTPLSQKEFDKETLGKGINVAGGSYYDKYQDPIRHLTMSAGDTPASWWQSKTLPKGGTY